MRTVVVSCVCLSLACSSLRDTQAQSFLTSKEHHHTLSAAGGNRQTYFEQQYGACPGFVGSSGRIGSRTSPRRLKDSAAYYPDIQQYRVLDSRRVSSVTRLRPVPTVLPEPERLVVIGDVHGDIDAFRSCLQMAHLVNDAGRWTGGETVLVQMGDVFDRGESDLEIEEWLYVLSYEAEKAGGRAISMLGNHEAMCCAGDHSMAMAGADRAFQDLHPELQNTAPPEMFERVKSSRRIRPGSLDRVVAMLPGQPVARMIANHPVCLKVGSNLLVHGGLVPQFIPEGIESMEQLNQRARLWLLGQGPMPQEFTEELGPVFARVYSMPPHRDLAEASRKALEATLKLTGTKRMIVGHTPQLQGINSAANGQVWRVDVGMTRMFGGRPEALQIMGNEITVLTEYKPVPGRQRSI